MGAQERLTTDEVRAGSLLAAHHLHRYEWASRQVAGLRVLDLCCGSGYGTELLGRAAASAHGVDIDEDAVAAALRNHQTANTTFETGDAMRWLQHDLGEQYDAIVCLEGVEHLPDPALALDRLAHLAQQGMRLILSLPNDEGFDEENEFHTQVFGYSSALDAFERFDDAIVIFQWLTEGSLIGRDLTGEVATTVVEPERADPEYANHYLALIGTNDNETTSGRMSGAVAANHSAYMRSLERANTELRRANLSLMRGHLGSNDSAAAAMLARQAELVERIEELESELQRWQAHADQLATAVETVKSWYDAPRYRAVDAVRARLGSLPRVVRAALRLSSPKRSDHDRP